MTLVIARTVHARVVLPVLLALFVLTPSAFARDDNGPGSNSNGAAASSAPATREEVDALREEVRLLREQLKELRDQLATIPAAKQATVKAASVVATAPAAVSQEPKSDQKKTETGKPQASSAPDDERVAVAPKSQGGDLSGAGNLLRTDRITIGGYGDFQFRESSVSEKAEGGGTPTFQNTRLVIGIAAVLAEKQNIYFNSEIEYEFGSREIDVEQAYVEWRARPEFAFRGGIFTPALGRFNVYHDSNINLTTIRPLISQYIVGTAYHDTGLGLRGRIKLPGSWKLVYEADMVNGMQKAGEGGEEGEEFAEAFSRVLGQAEAAEGGNALQDLNRSKAFVGRIGLSPFSGFEFGGSGYVGKINRLGEPEQSANIFFVDASYHHGALAINGEYGRSNIVGGIPRKSPAPPVVDPNDPESIEELAEFVASPSPGQDGFYIEGSYQFTPKFLTERLDEGTYIAPVFRYEAVRLDRTISDFFLNRSRVTAGLNFAPSSTVIFKFNYLFDHPFGPVPDISGPIGGLEFAENPLPYDRYGKNGFTGSISFVF